MNMIRLEGIYKTYSDGHEALKDVNLTFQEGEISVLIGPSGCGKTTTMKLINRLIDPTKGEIYIEDENISKTNPVDLRRKIGYVIQHIGLFPHMTIEKNVAVVPKLLKWDNDKIEKRTSELLDLVGLDPEVYRKRYPSELSGGQQQRIGVIRALAAEPSIILMDEPFSALDPISREQLQDELIRLQQQIRKTIVFVTHDMDEALKIADRIVLMRDGTVVQNGTPEQILRHPADDFVKDFIGKKRLNQEGQDMVATAKDVMAENPATAFPFRGLAEAIKMMERRRVDSLIVINKDGTLRGQASIFNVIKQYREEDKTLEDVMRPVPHVVQSEAPLQEVVELMDEQQLPYVPVVKEDNQFVGLITRGSIVSHLADLYPSGTDEEQAGDH